MKRKIALLLTILLVFSLCGCKENATPPATVGPTTPSATLPLPTQGPTEPAEPDTDLVSEEELFELLFDIENKIELKLDMAAAELQKMQSDYDRYDRNGSKSPIYRKGNLQVTITTPAGQRHHYTIQEVGVRMKGNTSRTDFYTPEEGIYNIIHLKISFQETFDDPAYYGTEAKVWTDEARKERQNRTFATLEKMDLRWNRCDDSTYLKEYFAYETYRQYGVPAPHTNLAGFRWAGVHMGVFTINEPIDKAFLKKNLPQEALGGDLYKIGWAGNNNGSFTDLKSVGIENEDTGKFYAYDLKTNKKDSTHESLKKLINSFNDGSVSKEEFASLVDLQTFLPYCAVSYLLGNPDDLRNNYNNCYLYFRADTGKAMIIPYDFDRCLGITTHWNPTGNGVTADDPFSKTLQGTGKEQRNPLILYSVAKGGYFVREYAQILKDIIYGDWFTFEQFSKLYETAKAHYGTLTRPGKAFHNADHLFLSFDLNKTSDFASQNNISFHEYLNAKLRTLTRYLEKVDDNAQVQPPQVPTVWYIRADYTNWNNDESHTLKNENGLWVYEIVLGGKARMKIFNDATGEWFGTERIAEDCLVSYESDHHGNIVLPQGNYRISLDPTTLIITIEEQS